jgi:hypothetical protein
MKVRRFDCTRCDTAWCVWCSTLQRVPTPNHTGTCQTVNVTRARELQDLASLGVLPCPVCIAPIEKNGGCSHVECTSCGAHFCWKCRVQFSSYHAREARGTIEWINPDDDQVVVRVHPETWTPHDSETTPVPRNPLVLAWSRVLGIDHDTLGMGDRVWVDVYIYNHIEECGMIRRA